MSDYPSAIYTQREIENVPKVVYDETKKTKIFAEDLTKLGDEITAIETDLKKVKVYRALLSQSGTNAPTAIVLENSLGGEVVWTRDTTGVYFGTLEDAFPIEKTFISSNLITGYEGYLNGIYATIDLEPDRIRVSTFIFFDSLDDELFYTPVEVFVYS
jgi:hypothetical protein